MCSSSALPPPPAPLSSRSCSPSFRFILLSEADQSARWCKEHVACLQRRPGVLWLCVYVCVWMCTQVCLDVFLFFNSQFVIVWLDDFPGQFWILKYWTNLFRHLFCVFASVCVCVCVSQSYLLFLVSLCLSNPECTCHHLNIQMWVGQRCTFSHFCACGIFAIRTNLCVYLSLCLSVFIWQLSWLP